MKIILKIIDSYLKIIYNENSGEDSMELENNAYFWQKLAKKVEVTLMEFAASLTISSRFYNRWLIISKSTTEFI